MFPREALKKFLDRFLNDKVAALVAARYIKGHHVCFSLNTVQSEIEHTSSARNCYSAIMHLNQQLARV